LYVTVIEHEAFAAVVKLAVAFEPGVTGEVTDLLVVAAPLAGAGVADGASVEGAAVGARVGLDWPEVAPALTVAWLVDPPHPTRRPAGAPVSSSTINSLFISGDGTPCE
jgi:hypothetical protein